jgi:putative ABC transport system permease protein
MGIWRDTRYGIRMLAKSPGTALAAAIALGLGIGLTTASFSIVYGIMWRGLPFEGGDRIMGLSAENPARDLTEQGIDVHDFVDLRDRQRSFEGLTGITNGTVTISGDGKPERLDGAELTANGFDVIGVKPYLGRTFRPGEDAPGAAPVAVVGYQLWKNRLNGDPKAVGSVLRVNGRSTTVIGVMPPGFQFPINEVLWTPHNLDVAKAPRGGGNSVLVVGRLKPGVTLPQARAEMTALGQSLANQFPTTNKGWSMKVQLYTEQWLGKDARTILMTMLASVLCVLLIACINVASLVMSRASQRTREVAIRSALGALRSQVIRQVLVESLLLALLGAVGGIAIAFFAIRAFNDAMTTADVNLAFWAHVSLDLPVLAFGLFATVLSALVSGLVPAFQISRTPLSEVLKDEGRGSTSLRIGWLSRIVVVAELALSCVLLVAAGLMVESIVHTRTASYGFRAEHMLTLRVPLFEANFPKKTDRAAFYERLTERLQEIPGVTAVGGTTSVFRTGGDSTFFAVDGRSYPTSNDYPLAHNDVVTESFFHSLNVRMLEGREFGRLDTAASQPVAVINATLARQMWPHDSPLGKRIKFTKTGEAEPWRTIIGVIPDVRIHGVGDQKIENIYTPLAQGGVERFSYMIHTDGDALALVPAARAAVAALDKDTPIYFVKTIERAVFEDRFFTDLFGTVFSIFGLAALVLAAVGIYGVISFSVARRTQEIGVRMALGAQPATVLSMLLRQGLIQLGVGMLIGLPLAFVTGQLLTVILFQVNPTDPVIFAGVIAVLALVSLSACLIPGQRAMRVDPNTALRYA